MTVSFEDVLRARSDPARLNEASLSRVWQHVQKSGEKSFGIVTSWRAPEEGATGKALAELQKENARNFKRLQGELRGQGLGYIHLVGHWGNLEEPSLFVPGLGMEAAKRIRERYDQDAVLYSGPETGGEVVLFVRSGAIVNVGKFTPGAVAASYSAIKGKPFRFEYVAQTWSQNLLATNWGKPEVRLPGLVEELRRELVKS
jgi:hypothetical protein